MKQCGMTNVRVNVCLVVNSERFMKGVQAGNDLESKFVDQRIDADLAEQVTLCMLDTVLNTCVFVMKHASWKDWSAQFTWWGKGLGRQGVLT
jgi:hypothetical protein